MPRNKHVSVTLLYGRCIYTLYHPATFDLGIEYIGGRTACIYEDSFGDSFDIKQGYCPSPAGKPRLFRLIDIIYSTVMGASRCQNPYTIFMPSPLGIIQAELKGIND